MSEGQSSGGILDAEDDQHQTLRCDFGAHAGEVSVDFDVFDVPTPKNIKGYV